MRIVCPNCSAAYDVPDALLAGRKMVGCARCGREWQPAGPEPEPEPAQEPKLEQVPETLLEPPPPPVRPAKIEVPTQERRGMAGGDWAIDRLMAAPPPDADSSLALRLAWAASIVAILAILGAGYMWRADVMAVWPPSAHLYAVLGLVGPIR